MSAIKTRDAVRPRPARTSTTSTGHYLTSLVLKHSLSMGSATTNSVGSATTPKTGSIRSELNGFDEHDYEMTRQLMHELIDEIRIEKSYVSFNDMFLNRDEIVGCLLRIFETYAEEINGVKRITREHMLKLLEQSDVFNSVYTPVTFVNDWNSLRKLMIKTKVYERRIKSFDFTGFLQLLDMIRQRLHRSKDAVFGKIISAPIYQDAMNLKELRDRSELGLLPPMDVLIQQYHQVSR